MLQLSLVVLNVSLMLVSRGHTPFRKRGKGYLLLRNGVWPRQTSLMRAHLGTYPAEFYYETTQMSNT